MAEWEDVARIAEALPLARRDEAKDGRWKWRVEGRLFVWQRPLKEEDIDALAEHTPIGEILAVKCGSLDVKAASIRSAPGLYFTTPHFKNKPTLLALLDALSVGQLDRLVVQAWLARAPRQVATAFLRDQEIRLAGRRRPLSPAPITESAS